MDMGAAGAVPGSTVRVLVVDDQATVARTVARWLEREGMPCDVAHSQRDALARFADRRYDIVFTDVHMPGGSGLDLARKLKAEDPSVQVIMMTGSTTLETAVEALRLNVDDYLLKPFEPAAMVHAAKRAAEHRRLLLENMDHRRHLEERVREQARRIEGLYLSSIHTLVRALEAKDPHTRGHSDRVAEYAMALRARVGGVPSESLRIGAQLHDVGKIGITTGILRKDGPLSIEEFEQVRRHPTIGVEILSPLMEDREALGVVHHHHERWDGAGYPDGLAGEAIPMGARIVAVADSFDAMISSRPYRAGRTREKAVAELEAEAGRQFDPAVVRFAAETFLEAPRLAS